MPAPDWPAAFPALPAVEGYAESPPACVLRTEMNAGPDKVRRRFTSGPRHIPVTLYMTSTVLNAASPNGFDAFFVQDTFHGSAEFTWHNPRTNADVTMRFVGVPKYEPVGGSSAYRVTFEVEILP